MQAERDFPRIAFDRMCDEFHRVLLEAGFAGDRARMLAEIFAANSRDGVYSHGLNTFAGFIENVRQGRVVAEAVPERIAGFGVLEQWDGRNGPGPLSARASMARAIALAQENVAGCVALRNTNHWMRGGTYGLQAAEVGCVGVCWTNTMPLMPPWGSAQLKLGNNPLVVGVPRREGHVFLDAAMTQFSSGRRRIYQRSGEPLPVPGGYDGRGRLTCDPDAIAESNRPLPIGCWKGSGLALVLDLLATLLSGGLSTCDIGKHPGEAAVSQVFIAIDVTTVAGREFLNGKVDEIIEDLRAASPLEEGQPVTYPGERMLRTREDNLARGIPADPEHWRRVLAM